MGPHVRVVGRPAGGTDADASAVEALFREIGPSLFTNDVNDSPSFTMPDACLRGPSTWTATVTHPDEVDPRYHTDAGKVPQSCNQC